jgi:hypothetical protein
MTASLTLHAGKFSLSSLALQAAINHDLPLTRYFLTLCLAALLHDVLTLLKLFLRVKRIQQLFRNSCGFLFGRPPRPYPVTLTTRAELAAIRPGRIEAVTLAANFRSYRSHESMIR